jgi:phage-related protein
MGETEWNIHLHDRAVEEFLSLPPKLGAKLLGLLDMVEEEGLLGIPSKRRKHLRSEIWEFRVDAAEGTARALYCTRKKKVWILVVFVNKTEQMPPRIIDLAEKRSKEIEP